MENKKIIIYCDGGSRGNPGPAASAFVATTENKVIYKQSKYLGVETNNVAEYTAVLLAIEWLSSHIVYRKLDVTINLDSQLVERQLNGFYKIKNIKLKILFEKIKTLLTDKNLSVKFIWNYRESNKMADKLVNEELDNNQ